MCSMLLLGMSAESLDSHGTFFAGHVKVVIAAYRLLPVVACHAD